MHYNASYRIYLNIHVAQHGKSSPFQNSKWWHQTGDHRGPPSPSLWNGFTMFNPLRRRRWRNFYRFDVRLVLYVLYDRVVEHRWPQSYCILRRLEVPREMCPMRQVMNPEFYREGLDQCPWARSEEVFGDLPISSATRCFQIDAMQLPFG